MKTVILCGGSGTRLWPLSRTLYPKQFYPLFEGHSLFQRTILRNVAHTDEFIVVVNSEQYFMAQDQYEVLKLSLKAKFILEPEGRNTAPAIALAAMVASSNDTLLIVPSDHLIHNLSAFHQSVKSAAALAAQGSLVTFGIKPTHPETGFGYLESEGDNVKRFKEKPDLKTAQEYIASGKFFWNSGMFCFKSQSYLQALEQFAPAAYASSRKAFNQANQDGPIRIDAKLMHEIPADSIDYAVMEKAPGIKMVPADMGWSDLGSFDALYEALPKDAHENTIDKHV
jgi:mannose-1-phosphate guanylyltransferase